MIKTYSSNQPPRQKGFSLLEIMIALVLSSVVIGGTLSVFVNTKKSQRFTNALSQIQESGRFALEFLKHDVRMIGYQGCNSYGEPTVNIVSNVITQANFEANKFQGYEVKSGWAAGTPFSSKIQAINGTDAISLTRVTDFSSKNKLMAQSSNQIEVSNSPEITISPKAHMLVMISDCESADLFKVTSLSSDSNAIKLNHSTGSPIRKSYDTDSAKISSYRQVIYFIGDTKRKNERGDPIYALYQAKAPFTTQHTQELIEGVENMQILYGESLPSGNMRYVPANQTGPDINWRNVKSVKIALLMTTNQAVRTGEDTSTYQLLNTELKAPGAGVTTAHSGGYRLKKVFSTTINIRNRVE